MGDWRKSTYSGANGGDCVEVASTVVIMIRDTADPNGVLLVVPSDAWRKFTASFMLFAASIFRCAPFFFEC